MMVLCALLLLPLAAAVLLTLAFKDTLSKTDVTFTLKDAVKLAIYIPVVMLAGLSLSFCLLLCWVLFIDFPS